jgi:WD40 repeat protein
VTVGADRRIQLYDGKTGEATKQVGESEHKGTIFAVSWAQDSKRFATSSADQTVKLWDAEVGKAVQTWRFGEEGIVSIPDHQVGVVWPSGRGDGLVISLNLAGDLNYLVEGSQQPTKIVQGHNKSITALGSSHHGKDQTFWTGSFDGRVCAWDVATGVGSAVEGESHKNQVTAFETTAERAYSVGWDDTLRIADVSQKTFLGDTVKLSAQPKGLTSAEGQLFAATVSGIDIFLNDDLVGTMPTKDFTPTSIAAHGSLVAVGTDSNIVQIYTVDSSRKLSPKETLTHSTAQITALGFSPDGSLLAVGNSSGKIVVYETSSWEVKTDRWSAHTARVTSLAWNDEGTLAVSGALDTNVHVWSLKSPGKRIKAPNAHKDGVNGVAFVDGGKRIASTGGDAALKIWDVSGVE